jgi:hypothetical protein
MHASALAMVVVERAMLGAAVVPDRHRADLPAESAGQFRLHRMRHQEFDDRLRLGVPETVQRLRVVADIERLAAGFGVGAYERVRGLRLQVSGVTHLGRHLFVAHVAPFAR